MEQATIRLNNSILGWMLFPVSENSIAFLNDMYVFPDGYDKAKPSERAFMKGEPIQAVIAHIKEVCKGMEIKVSFCGKRNGPTIRLWRRHPLEVRKPEEVSVDLKWSCWTTDESIWNDYAPGVWERMQKAFTGESGPVTVGTGPRKEIRYGSVTIYRGGASGYFCTNWDECEMLAETLGTTCDDAFVEMIPHSIHCMEPGMDWDFGLIKARKFINLMRKIDAQENELLVMDEREWKFIADCFRKTPTCSPEEP